MTRTCSDIDSRKEMVPLQTKVAKERVRINSQSVDVVEVEI